MALDFKGMRGGYARVMSTLFTKIIEGELPGAFVWKDDICVAFLSIAPLAPGHTLVVPRREVDHWLDLDGDELAHVMTVAQTIGKALDTAYGPVKVGMLVAGLEVPHVHVHVSCINGVHDLDFANADSSAGPEDLGEAADKIRAALREMGHDAVWD